MDAKAWMRWVQLGAAWAIGAIAVHRDRWPAVLLVAIAVRVALDPEIYLYYGTGLVVAAFVWDALRSPRALPLMTLFAFVFLNDAYTLVGDSTVRAMMRLVVTAGVVILVLIVPGPSASRRGESASRL